MLDLTFGEQVKIILSRKGMTIKDLAEIIEKRTGKKMSRQNLTQRLGRDNFQEQDMRMIAEILECPFRLSILSDSEALEEIQNEDGRDKPQIQSKPQPTTKESIRIAKAKARKEKKAKEADRLADAMEKVPTEMRKEPVEKEMTLGDYIDIHEELVRQETEKLPQISGESVDAVETETSETEISEKENSVEKASEKEISAGEASEKDASAEQTSEKGVLEAETVEKEVQEETEGLDEAVLAEGSAQETEKVASSEESVQEREEVASSEEFAQEEESEQPEASENEAQPKVDVEELLREMEELERERKLLEQQVKEAKEAKEAKALEEPVHEERKITGWRAMFHRRTKKERQEYLQEDAKIEEQAILRESEMEELEDDYVEYGEPEAELEEEIESSEEREEQPVSEEMFEELLEEDEDAEDLSRGERNPYTGHEYETNSVRMHPKRIGYVQLYDRRDHGWTDMTEWAFLGYQERKKALLGKDYDPPIYLD